MPLREVFTSPWVFRALHGRQNFWILPFSSLAPERAWRKNALGRHMWGLQWASSFGVPSAVCGYPLSTGVRAPPHQPGSPGSGRLFKPHPPTPPWPASWNRIPSGTVVGRRPPLHLSSGLGSQLYPFSLCLCALCGHTPPRNSFLSSSLSHRQGFKSQPHCWPAV